MSIASQVTERKKRRPPPPPVNAGRVPTHPDKLLSFNEWCFLCGISPRTGRRIMAAGEGPPIVRLSPQRYGIRVADNARWQAARARKRK
jgi:predicted DNA-binding transcriptional regulator AlpA